MVVYDTETLKPTVELGVWEPETTLARLQLVNSSEASRSFLRAPLIRPCPAISMFPKAIS